MINLLQLRTSVAVSMSKKYPQSRKACSLERIIFSSKWSCSEGNASNGAMKALEEKVKKLEEDSTRKDVSRTHYKVLGKESSSFAGITFILVVIFPPYKIM